MGYKTLSDFIFDSFLFDTDKIITIIGSGGKTSLIELLARERKKNYSDEKILVTTSTHIRFPDSNITSGITYAGIRESGTQKLVSLPMPELNRLVNYFDFCLIEGDGSREKPLKAWENYEPVIPECSKLIIAVIPLRPIGKPIDETIVHRLPLFLKLTDTKEGEILRCGHYRKIILGNEKTGSKGLLHHAVSGEKQTDTILFFNQVEDERTLFLAGEITESLEKKGGKLPKSIKFIIAGSVLGQKIAGLTIM